MAMPPGAEKPPSSPLEATIRWQGTMIGKGLRPSDWPTSRAEASVADAGGELGVADHPAGRDRPRRGVDAAVERIDPRIVDADEAEVGALAVEQGGDRGDGRGVAAFRAGLGRLREALGDPLRKRVAVASGSQAARTPTSFQASAQSPIAVAKTVKAARSCMRPIVAGRGARRRPEPALSIRQELARPRSGTRPHAPAAKAARDNRRGVRLPLLSRRAASVAASSSWPPPASCCSAT